MLLAQEVGASYNGDGSFLISKKQG